MPGQTGEDTARQGRYRTYPVVGGKGVQEGECQAHQQVRHQSAQPDDELVEGLDADDPVDVLAAEYDSGNTQCGKDEHRPDQGHAQIVAEAPGPAANAGYVQMALKVSSILVSNETTVQNNRAMPKEPRTAKLRLPT